MGVLKLYLEFNINFMKFQDYVKLEIQGLKFHVISPCTIMVKFDTL
jgi:hypothetical protein